MANKKKRYTSIRRLMIGYLTVFIISIFVLVGIALFITYLATKKKVDATLFPYEMALLGIALVLVILLLLFTNFRVYRLCYKGLYQTSKTVIEDIAINKQFLPRYPNKKIAEFEALNEALDKTQDHLQKSVVFSKSNDYSALDLVESNQKLGTIEFESFAKEIPEIIMLCQAFRNAFMHISYGDKLQDLVGQSELETIKNIRRIFDYDNMLIVDDADKTGYIVYIPQIDSLNRLKEESEYFIKNSSMVKNTPNGKATVLAKISVVLYPFSNSDEIISDLNYADRQGQHINFYLPDRIVKADNDKVVHGAHSLNCSNQAILNLASIRIHENKSLEIKDNIKSQLIRFGAFLNADHIGVIMRDDKINKFINYVAINNRETAFMNEGEIVTPEMLTLTNKVADSDGSYFFSSRSHLNSGLGSYLDKYGLTSGFLYLVTDDNGPLGLVYFLNYQREMNFDSYMQESVFAISYQIGSVIRENNQLTRLRTSNERNDILMKLSNYMVYAVDKNTYEIIDTSETFRDTFGKCNKKVCYKAIYGLNHPCDDCPIQSQKKMLKPFKNVSYETSLVINNSTENLSRMLIKKVEKDAIDHNRFDPDFLINSYYSLTEDLNNIYSVSGRGHILLLAFENYKNILHAYGNEGYVAYIRKLTNHLNDSFGKEKKFYLYDNSKIALVLPDSGNSEIIDICEKIYSYSKEPFIDIENKEFIPIKTNYIAIKYPQEYPTHTDLLRHAESALGDYEQSKHIDEIHFDGTDYYRSASRTEFISEVIEKSFKEGSFKVNLQPILHSVTKHIVGAEILIRLSDDYRGQQLSAYEVIKAAAQQNKIGIISDGLINYIGDIYQKYGLTLFKTRSFTRLSLNTDYSYFADENFLKNISQMVAKYSFPKNFLAFEIVEQELSDHYEAFKSICSKLRMLGVHIAVDQYTGKYLSLEKVKAVGIQEIKIARNLVKDIDVNKASLSALSQVVKTTAGMGLEASVVGVENKDQYLLIRDMTKESLMQGFFFYAPLELPQLIETVKVN